MKGPQEVKELEKEWHVSRYIIVYKFLLGVLELTLAFGMLLFGRRVAVFYYHLQNNALLEGPYDIVFDFLRIFVPYLLAHRGYVTVFLIVLGLVKVFGAIGLYYHKYWGVDLLVILTTLLLPFQIFEMLVKPSLAVLFFMILGIFIGLYLTKLQPLKYYSNLVRRLRRLGE